jgi:hypothetical protein
MSSVSRSRDSGHLERAVATVGGQETFDAAVAAMLDDARGWRLAEMHKCQPMGGPAGNVIWLSWTRSLRLAMPLTGYHWRSRRRRAIPAAGRSRESVLSGVRSRAGKTPGQHVRLPAGHWTGERAATDILVLARKGRAFASLDTLIARQGGMHVLYGSALSLAATIQAWAAQTDTPVSDLARTAVR